MTVSECEYKTLEADLALAARNNDNLRDELKSSNRWIAGLLILALIMAICACTTAFQNVKLKEGAISHGVLQYNSTNGALEWIDNNKSKQ